jgi:hypothetical protein
VKIEVQYPINQAKLIASFATAPLTKATTFFHKVNPHFGTIGCRENLHLKREASPIKQIIQPSI